MFEFMYIVYFNYFWELFCIFDSITRKNVNLNQPNQNINYFQYLILYVNIYIYIDQIFVIRLKNKT